MMDVVPNILTWIDGTIHYYSKQTNLPPLIKAIFVYIVVFCAVFYGIFAKMNYSRGRGTRSNRDCEYDPSFYA